MLFRSPNHTRQQAHHGVRSIIGRLLKMLQACLLDLPNEREEEIDLHGAWRRAGFLATGRSVRQINPFKLRQFAKALPKWPGS